mgnify:CR=1 FL=1
MIKCPLCGAEYHEGKCPVCGYEEKKTWVCPLCGAEVRNEEHVCPVCGKEKE